MTAATSYTTLDSDDLGANKILRAATMSALDQNPVSIAQRGTGAPWLNGVGAMETITSGSGNWTVPAGVYRIKAICIGSGGGISGSANTVFGSVTAGAGGAGGLSGGVPISGSGGAASGGDINISGEAGDINKEFRALAPIFGGSKGAGDMPSGGGSGSGAVAIKCLSVEPGDTIAYSLGGNGIIIIEY